MITDLKPYPRYKPSGVAWLGEVPAHWDVERLKRCMANIIEQTNVRNDSELYVGLEHVESWTGRLTEVDEDIEFDSQVKSFEAGDILFGKLRPYLAKVTRPTRNGVCVGEFLVLRPRDKRIVGACIERSLRAKPMIDAVDSSTFGAKMPRADWQFVGAMPIAVPPVTEQIAIVRFLDHADRRIRRSVRAKEKLIALLEEQKQAAIHQAVTGRIDVRTGRPYPIYKPSGVEWLGDVPAHWEFRAAKWHYREVDERSKTGTEELLSVSHITGVTPRSEKNVTMFKAESNVGHKLCKSDDIVVNTMWAWMAALGVAKQAGIVSPSYAVYRSRHSSDLRGDYANLLLRTTAYRNEYRRRSTGIRSSRLRLYPEEFLRIKIFCPPPEEQQHIVSFVANESKAQQRLLEFSRREIDLLREYRTRLIADVVTGKLDVREAAAVLPEEPDDLDAAEAGCDEPEGGDDGLAERDRGTAVPATPEEMTP